MKSPRCWSFDWSRENLEVGSNSEYTITYGRGGSHFQMVEKDKSTVQEFPPIGGLELISQFERLIHFVTNRYILNKSIHPYDQGDLIQFVQLRIVETLPRIRDNFKGQSLVKTYMSAVVLNLCREFKRKNCSKSVYTRNEEDLSARFADMEDSQEVEKNLYIADEVEKLNQIFILYGLRQNKVKLALRAYYGIDLSELQIRSYASDMEVGRRFLSSRDDKQPGKKKTTVHALTELFNEVENKQNSTEATRKWLSRLVENILSILNNGSARYTKEVLGILLEVHASSPKYQ